MAGRRDLAVTICLLLLRSHNSLRDTLFQRVSGIISQHELRGRRDLREKFLGAREIGGAMENKNEVPLDHCGSRAAVGSPVFCRRKVTIAERSSERERACRARVSVADDGAIFERRRRRAIRPAGDWLTRTPRSAAWRASCGGISVRSDFVQFEIEQAVAKRAAHGDFDGVDERAPFSRICRWPASGKRCPAARKQCERPVARRACRSIRRILIDHKSAQRSDFADRCYIRMIDARSRGVERGDDGADFDAKRSAVTGGREVRAGIAANRTAKPRLVAASRRNNISLVVASLEIVNHCAG